MDIINKLDLILLYMNKFDDADECIYGDFDCDHCSSLDEDTVCTTKLVRIIRDELEELKTLLTK